MAVNGRLNCLLEICCGAPAALAALGKQIVEDVGCKPAEAAKLAKWIKAHVDLAPKGTLEPFYLALSRPALAVDVAQLTAEVGCSADESSKYAAWVAENFDLAPKGTLGALFKEVARLAKLPPYKDK